MRAIPLVVLILGLLPSDGAVSEETPRNVFCPIKQECLAVKNEIDRWDCINRRSPLPPHDTN